MKTKRLTAMLLAAAMTLGTFSSVALATDTENTTGSGTLTQTSGFLSSLDEQTLKAVVASAEAQYAASKSSGVAAISEDDGTADLTAEERSSVKESIYNDILFSDSSVVDVSGYDMDADTLSTLTDEVLAEEGMTELVDYEYEEDEVSGNATVAVYSVNNELAAAADEASEIAVIAEDGTSSALTEEQLQTVLYLYSMYLEDYNANVAYLGRQTPFFTSQESDSEDGLGQLGSMLILAGATVDQVRNGEYSYDTLVGTIQTFYYGDVFGVDFYGSDMISAKNEALQAVEESGASTEAQKLLVLNEWMADRCSFDMEYIMNMSSDDPVLVASDPQQSEHYDEMYQEFYQLYEADMIAAYGEDYGPVYAGYAADQMVTAVEGMWNGNLIGALALGKGVCMAYTSAYTYLVQWMNPEVYAANGKTLTTDADSWKTTEELNCESETTTKTTETTVQVEDEDGNALYYVLGEDGNKVASTEGDGYESYDGYQVTTTDTGAAVTKTTTVSVPTTTYTVSTNADYLVDFVMINYQADVTMYGEEQEDFGSQHFWNAVKVDGEWYYIDVCYIDIFTECMIRDRVETNGDMNHMYFLMSDATARNMYDGYFTSIVTLYEDVATDTSYENNSWVYFAASNIYSDGNGKYYYAYDSTDMIDALDNPSSYFNTTTEYKIVYHEASAGDKDLSYTTLVDLTGGTVYNPTTGELEDNELIQELYALHEEYAEKYSSLSLTMALYDDMIYFNLANCVLSYDLDTGEVAKVKEYNEVGAVRDDTVAFAGMAFDVVYDLSEADVTVMDPPVAGLTIYDGNLCVDLATSYAYISGKDAHNYSDSSSYGWEFQESNYNSDYDAYMAQMGYETDENDNDEFMWSANFTDTIAMSELTSSEHNYETVSVDATCDHNAFTESRCADCGAIEADTRVEEEDTACEHHYVKFDETYYTKDDDGNWNTGTCYVCVICGDAVEEDDDDWDTAVANAAEGHDYVASEEGITWADDYSTATITELTCDPCGSLVSNIVRVNDDGENEETTVPSWDCLQDDDTITVALEEALTCDVTSEVVSGTCDEGVTVTYTAVGSEGSDYEGVVLGQTSVTREAGEHSYTTTFNWAEDYSTCTVDLVCSVCSDEQSVNCEVTPVTTAATCTEAGQTVYTATATVDGTEYTDTKTVTIDALGHSYGEPTFNWADDYSTCEAVFTCAACDDVQTVDCDVDYETTDATCTTGGTVTYTATATFEDETYTDTQTTTVDALGHDYGEPTFTWSEDYSTCTATFTCARCDDEQTVDCEVASDTTAATCTEAGQTVYTATATFEDETYTDTKTVAIDALGHSYGEPTFTWADDNTCTATFTCATCGDVQTVDCDVTYETTDATCTTGGTVTYTATATFEDETYTDTQTTTVDALGHSYGDPTFTWSEDYSTCTATFACTRCDDEQTVSCNVTSATTDATCTEAGATVYTATATFEDETYTDTKTVEIPALGHTYTAAPTFTWADDNTCTATFTCATCGETETVTCDVTYETADATCTTGGTVTYTATATIDGTSYTDTKVAEVEALGHDYGEPTFNWADDDTCTATFTCTRCGDTQTVDCDVVENEDGSLTATCTFGDETYTNVKATTPVDEIFTDVTADDWYYEAVQFVYDHDLMVGTSDTTFSPTMTTTRAMVVQILYNMEDQPEVSGEMPFSDVSESDWYYNAVLWAYQNDVTAGDGNGNFNPTTKVTREQFAQFLYNYEGKPEVSGTIDFTDASSVSSWATDAILWATQNGIMNGKDNNGVITLDPQGQATRAEVAAMLKNYCENV